MYTANLQPNRVLILTDAAKSQFAQIAAAVDALGAEPVICGWDDLPPEAAGADLVFYSAEHNDLSGLTAVRRAAPGLPVVALAASDAQGELCLRAGADEYVLYDELHTSAAQRLLARLAAAGSASAPPFAAPKSQAEADFDDSQPCCDQLYSQVLHQNQELEELINERTSQLRRLNERMAAILNSVSDAIVLLEANSAIEIANPAFYNMFGYETDELFMQPLTVLAVPDQREQLAAALQAVYDGQRTLSLQLSAQRKDGTRFDADIALSRVDDAGDGEAYVVCSVRDISHHKQIERMKDRFVSMVSHELRTPTTSIVLSTHSLRAYYDRMDESKRRAIIERLEEQALVLADLIEGILDLSHLDSRSQPPASHSVDMSAVMAGAINDLKPAAETKQHLITLRVDYTQSVHVLGDVMDFRRIWRNLVSNAIKYTPDRGHITIRLGRLSVQADAAPSCSANISAQSLRLPAGFRPGEYVVGQVEDNGHGIPADQVAQLTTRFYRGWAAQSNIPGTGLGLSLVHELLTLYGGGLSIVSEEGRGSVFSFWLPAAPEGKTTQ